MIQKDKLIAQINAKDIKGFRTLYEQVYPMLVSYVSEIILSDEAAEDIVQDLFVYIWESDVTFPTFTAFRSYLYTYVRNTALDYLKHQHIEQDYANKMAEMPEMPEEDELNREEEYQKLFSLIDELPEQCRKVFLMALDGKKNKEIADALQISITSVKTQKMRAMQKIKKTSSAALFSALFCLRRNLPPHSSQFLRKSLVSMSAFFSRLHRPIP